MRRARAADGRAGLGSARRRLPGARRAPTPARSATDAWWRWRTASVRIPRSPLRASNGDAAAPCSTLYAQIASSRSPAPAITPRVASLCPEIPFVAECRTRSMPWRSGCWPIGVANVESSTVNGPLTAPELVEVDEVESGVGRRLGDDEHRPSRTHGLGERAGLGAVDDRVLDAEAGARALHEGDRAGVDLALDDDVVAGRAQGEHGRGDGTHARAERQRVLGALELGDRLLERPHGRVGVAAVEVARPHPGRPLAGVVEAVGRPCARAPQRHVEARTLVAAASGDGACRGGGLVAHERRQATAASVAGQAGCERTNEVTYRPPPWTSAAPARS